MSIRLSEDEAWSYLTEARVGILTTLRADGWPVALPVWHAVADQRVYVRTLARTAKVRRVRHDERAGYLVEGGQRWAELHAVSLTARAAVLDDAATLERVGALLEAKYAAVRSSASEMPAASVRHYSGKYVVLELTPTGPPITWDNRRLRR